MTWRAEVTESIDTAIEDEIRRELDSLDLENGEFFATDQDSYFTGTLEPDSPLGDADIVDDVVKQYASRLEQRTALFERELLECTDLLGATKNHVSIDGAPHDGWQLVPVAVATGQSPRAVESTREEILSLLDDDDDESSSDDGHLAAVEWLPPNSHEPSSSMLPPRLGTAQQRGYGDDEPAPSAASESAPQTSRAGSGEHDGMQGSPEEQQQQPRRDQGSESSATVAEAAERRHAAAAASRERYNQAAARGQQDHEDLRRQLLAADEEQERGRAERTAKLQLDAELLKKQVEDQRDQLQKELDFEDSQLSSSAAELQERIEKMDEQLREERASLRGAIVAQQLRQEQNRLRAAIVVQSAYRGHRARKMHGAKLNARLAAIRDEAAARRVRELEAVRQAATEAAERRQQELQEQERRTAARKQVEEEERRRKATEEAEEERRRREAEEEERRRQKEAKRLARRAEKERLKRAAEEEEALKRAREKEAEEERRRRRAAEAEAAEREKEAKQKEEEERMLRQQKEAEDCKRDEAAATLPVATVAAAAATAATAAASDEQRGSTHGQPHGKAADKVASERTGQASQDRNHATAADALSDATAQTGQGRIAAAAASGEHVLRNQSAAAMGASASAIATEVATEAAGATAIGRVVAEAPLPTWPSNSSQSLMTVASAAESGPASDRQHGASMNGALAMPSSGLASADPADAAAAATAASAAALQAAQIASSAAAAARQQLELKSEKRLTEMQLLKERMEKLQSGAAFSSRPAGADGSSRAPAAAAATASASADSSGFSKAGAAARATTSSTVASVDLSLVGRKMEERRMRWMKECTPWSSILVEAANRKVPLQPKKYASKKIETLRKALPESTVMEAAGDGIVSLQQLQAVQLDDLPGYSLSAVAACRRLQAAVVRRCNLTSLDDFVDSPCTAGLLLLDCQANSIDKLAASGSFDNLTVLDLSSNHLTSTAGLEACHALRLLSLAKNKITRIAGLAHLRRLHTLDLSCNQLINTKGVGEAVTLQMLDVSHNHLSVVDDVDKLCLLESLYAQGNNIRDIPRLGNAVLLRDLLLSDNSISTLGSLSHSWLPSLSHLAISHNSLSALLPLHGCPSLKYVDLRHNQLVDVHNVADSLKFCVNLEELLLDGTPAACRANYRVQLLGLLPRVRQVDGIVLTEAADDLYPSDFLRACAARQRRAEKLRTDWSEQTRIPADQKLTGVEIMRLCAAHASYFEQSSVHAQDSRSMHEYGELGAMDSSMPSSVHPPGQGTASHGSAVGSAVAATMVGIPDAAPADAGALLAVLSTDDGGDAGVPKALLLHVQAPAPSSVASIGRGGVFDDGGSSSTSGGIGRPLAAAEGARRSGHSEPADSGRPTSGARAGRTAMQLGDLSSDGSDEIAAVGSVNRTPGHVLSKLVASASTGGQAASSRTVAPSKPPPEAATTAATVESKEAFEERLRAALESAASLRLLRSDGLVPPRGQQSQLSPSGANGVAAPPSVVTGLGAVGLRSSDRAGAGGASDLLAAGVAGGEIAATRIQAAWRGYALRKRLNSALRHARVDLSEAEDFSDYGEVDVTAFDLEEAQLDESWLPSQTPQLPKSYVALPSRSTAFVDGDGRRAAADILTILSAAAREPHPPVQPRHAWRSQSSTSKASTALGWGLEEAATAADPSAPTPALVGGGSQSHRSALSRKEELLAEEWGFKDQRTAELMVQRAKKLKYDAAKKKKLRKLDPQQKLAFLRRLEESAGPPPAVRAPAKKAPPKKEYFEAMEAEARQQQLEQRAEEAAKEQRMYEWVHTQVGTHFDYDDDDGDTGAAGAAVAGAVAGAAVRGRAPAAAADGLVRRQHNAARQDSLPYIERRLIQGGRAQLVASPLDVQSVDSAREREEQPTRQQQPTKHRKRLSEADLSKDATQLPPIKTNSAPSNDARKERISFRDQKVDLGPGWGGGRKRNSHR